MNSLLAFHFSDQWTWGLQVELLLPSVSADFLAQDLEGVRPELHSVVEWADFHQYFAIAGFAY